MYGGALKCHEATRNEAAISCVAGFSVLESRHRKLDGDHTWSSHCNSAANANQALNARLLFPILYFDRK